MTERFQSRLSRWLLALIAVGNVGLIAELLLLDHTESFNQWIPLVSLALGLITTILVWFQPNAATFRVFKLSMLVFVGAGLLGVYLHYAGNVEWAHERDPGLSGLTLVWKALKGATPALAPGALAQLGLLGLIFAWSQQFAQRTSITDSDQSGKNQ